MRKVAARCAAGPAPTVLLLDPGVLLPVPREKAVITQEMPGYKCHLGSLSWGKNSIIQNFPALGKCLSFNLKLSMRVDR